MELKMSEFKPIENLEQHEDLQRGDLILLKTVRSADEGYIDSTTIPVFYNCLDTCVTSDKNKDYEQGIEIRGIRIYKEHVESHEANGRQRFRDMPLYRHEILRDSEKGELIPFNGEDKKALKPEYRYEVDFEHQYALVARMSELPLTES